MISVRNLSFSYDDRPLLRNISFNVAQGSHLALVGESGSGKSTLLKLIYGHHDLDNGKITFNDKLVKGPKHKLVTGEEEMKYLAQNFGLMPFATTGENVGAFLSNTNKALKNKRIDELLAMVGMLEFKNVKPQLLSGGQQQRVAIAKALAAEPKVLLLDEPFSQIDTCRANMLRRDLFAFLKHKSITCIVATHNSADILAFADSVAVLKQGELIRFGTVQDVYLNPQTFYVASLFDTTSEVNHAYFYKLNYHGDSSLFYPHQLYIAETGLEVAVTATYFMGSHYLVEAKYDTNKVFFNHHSPPKIRHVAIKSKK